MSDDGTGRRTDQQRQGGANDKLVVSLEGLGELRREDGELIGMRGFEIQVWEHHLEVATPEGPLSVRGNATVSVTVKFHGAEATSLFNAGRPFTLSLQDGRLVTLTLKTAVGDLLYHGGLG